MFPQNYSFNNIKGDMNIKFIMKVEFAVENLLKGTNKIVDKLWQ